MVVERAEVVLHLWGFFFVVCLGPGGIPVEPSTLPAGLGSSDTIPAQGWIADHAMLPIAVIVSPRRGPGVRRRLLRPDFFFSRAWEYPR